MKTEAYFDAYYDFERAEAAQSDPTRPACIGEDPELFFPKPANWRAAEVAKQICAICPVRNSCLDEALERDEQFGIFGGLDERERQALKRRRPRSLA